jgi:hypothetical protein
MFPPIFDEALGFLNATELAADGDEQNEQGRPIIAAISGGVIDEPLGGC